MIKAADLDFETYYYIVTDIEGAPVLTKNKIKEIYLTKSCGVTQYAIQAWLGDNDTMDTSIKLQISYIQELQSQEPT
jgi:hypothetical protein